MHRSISEMIVKVRASALDRAVDKRGAGGIFERRLTFLVIFRGRIVADQKLSASQEDYLEAISHVIDEKRVARSKDLVRRLGVNSSSVTQALRALSQKELIHYEPYGVVTLTETGEELARDVIRRHRALNAFFTRILGVDAATAEDAACKMEHAMPRVIVDRLVEFIDYTDRCPRGSSEWVEGFGYFCRDRSAEDPRCSACELIGPSPDENA